MGKWTQEQLTCPECGLVMKNPNGLRGHRQFKHGVRSVGAQLPLQKQDLLISESRLEQLLDGRFAAVVEQLDALGGGDEQLAERIKELEQRLAAAERKTIDDFSPMEKAQFVIPWMTKLSGEDFVRLAVETGHDAQLVEVADPEAVARVVEGKTTEPGYRYLEHLGLSIKED